MRRADRDNLDRRLRQEHQHQQRIVDPHIDIEHQLPSFGQRFVPPVVHQSAKKRLYSAPVSKRMPCAWPSMTGWKTSQSKVDASAPIRKPLSSGTRVLASPPLSTSRSAPSRSTTRNAGYQGLKER